MSDNDDHETHEGMFLKLCGVAVGGLVQVSDDIVYICRICEMAPDIGIQTKTEWIKHLLSNKHQSIHRNHQLLRKVLWNLDRTIAVTSVNGIHQRDILSYIFKPDNCVVDFSYLSSKPGATDACYALMSTESEINKLLSAKEHRINGKKINIRRIDDKQKRKFLKWKEKILSNNKNLDKNEL